MLEIKKIIREQLNQIIHRDAGDKVLDSESNRKHYKTIYQISATQNFTCRTGLTILMLKLVM
jgi:hypothetical protein